MLHSRLHNTKTNPIGYYLANNIPNNSVLKNAKYLIKIYMVMKFGHLRNSKNNLGSSTPLSFHVIQLVKFVKVIIVGFFHIVYFSPINWLLKKLKIEQNQWSLTINESKSNNS